jgi:hypothetical protein
MKFPLNYYDMLLKARPEIVVNAESDGEDLRHNRHAGPIAVFEDETAPRMMPTLQKYADVIFRNIAKSSGMTVEQVKSLGGGNPEMVRYFESHMDTVGREYHSLVNFTLAGKKVFNFYDGLVQQLANTEMNVAAPYLRLPHSSCMFVLTSREAIEAMYSITREQDHLSEAQYSAPITVFASIFEPEQQTVFRRLTFVVYHADESAVYYETKRSMALIDEWNLEQALHTDWEKIDEDRGSNFVANAPDLADGDTVPDEVFYQDGLLFFRILINAILYISSMHAETREVASPHEGLDEKLKNTKSSLERRDIYREAQKSSRLPYILVGEGVTEVQSEDVANLGDSFRKKLSVRFIVRGHWRKQPYGTGRTERRLQFIQPYLKGPEMADLVNKPYLVR